MGGIDTHGFWILSRLREVFPGVVSVMLDEETLLRHKALTVREARQFPAEEPSGLTAGELRFYRALKSGRHGDQLRLEQERIPWGEARAALRKFVS